VSNVVSSGILTPMNYLFVKVNNEEDSIPVEMYHELDDLRFEKRRVEIFRDGSVGWADENTNNGKTLLTWESVGSLEEIGINENFLPEVISSEKFDQIWNMYAKQ
jgi:hypothetical protein